MEVGDSEGENVLEKAGGCVGVFPSIPTQLRGFSEACGHLNVSPEIWGMRDQEALTHPLKR